MTEKIKLFKFNKISKHSHIKKPKCGATQDTLKPHKLLFTNFPSTILAYLKNLFNIAKPQYQWIIMNRFLLILALVLAKLKVFIVFHSHNDAGWRLKAEDYYLDHTQHILNNVLDFLQLDPEFKFSWSESFYLSRYLDDYPERKIQIQQFIREGKLEIVGGGWVQNDEALPDLDFVLRQMSLGF